MRAAIFRDAGESVASKRFYFSCNAIKAAACREDSAEMRLWSRMHRPRKTRAWEAWFESKSFDPRPALLFEAALCLEEQGFA